MAEQCATIQQWLSAYLDNELDDRRLVEVRTHLDGCAVCRHELAAMQQTAQALQAWHVPQVDPQISAVFTERLAAHRSRRTGWVDFLARLRRPLAWSAGMAALLVMMAFAMHFSLAGHRVKEIAIRIPPTANIAVLPHPYRQVATKPIAPAPHNAGTSRSMHPRVASVRINRTIVKRGGAGAHIASVVDVPKAHTPDQVKVASKAGMAKLPPLETSVSPDVDVTGLAVACWTETSPPVDTADLAENGIGENAVVSPAALENPDLLLQNMIAETEL